MKKGFFRKTGAVVLAASLAVSMVQLPVYGATNKSKTITVSNQKELNKALKVAKGKKAYSIVIKSKNKSTNVTIPKGNYKNLTITVKGNKVKIKNNATLKMIVLECKDTVSLTNNGSVGKVEVQKAKSVSLSGTSKKEVKLVVAAEDTTITTKIAIKVACTCENANVTIHNKSDSVIKITDADGKTTKVKSGEKSQVTSDSKADDNKDDNKDNKTDEKKDDTKDNHTSSGSSSSGSSSSQTPSGLTEADLLKQGYKLKWKDDFNGDSLNKADWNVETHEPGWVNSEWQAYVDSADNIQVKDGKLLLKPVKTVDKDGNASYTSGRINTQGRHDFKYGYFECRAKVPTGKGYLPAFWMMPTDENLYGQWPKCGEIDIMEVMGQETNKAYGTIHYGEPHAQSQGTYSVSAADNFADNYHTYAVDWEPGKITWYIDGIKYHEESDWFSAKENQGTVAYPAPFDQPFYMILNLAVGGSWVGYPDDTTTYDDQEYAIDYVKVYQKDSYDENVKKPEKEVIFKEADTNGNYITNGEFSVAEDLSDDVDWKFLTAEGGKGSAKIENKEIVISTTEAGKQDYSIQLVQPNLPIRKGGTYTVSFDAYADAARTMKVDVSAPDRSFARYLADTDVDLTTQKQTYTYTFKMEKADDANGRLEFNLGKTVSTATVHITNVKVTWDEKRDTGNEKTILADGNSVYNGSFQEGENRLGYWDIVNDANASVSVTDLADGRRLKVTSAAGTESGKVLVGQKDLALMNGTNYVLSFSAQAAAAKSMNVTVAGKKYTAELDNAKKSYSFKFTQDSDNKDISFDLGLGTTVWLDDVRIDEDTLIKNGSFNAGFSGYEVYCHEDASETHVVDSQTEQNAADFTIKNTGDADWKIQLKQNNVKLENGKCYRLSMKMKSSLDRTVSYALQRNGAVHKTSSGGEDWTPYCQKTVSLTNDYQIFSSTFKMTEETDDGIIFNIAMGGGNITQQHRICIDDIVLEEIDESELEPEVRGDNLLKNTTFSDNAQNWDINRWNGDGKEMATTETVNDGIVFHISDVGTADWNIQLKQGGINLEQGCDYRLAFKVTSTESRTIKVGFMDKNTENWYGGSDVSLEKNKAKNVVCKFTMTKDTDAESLMLISMGKIEGEDTPVSDITLSDFYLEKLEASAITPKPLNENLFKNAELNSDDVWETAIYGGAEGDSKIGNGTAIFHLTKLGTDDWAPQFKQVDLQIEQGCTYRLSMNVNSTIARDIIFKVQQNGEPYTTYLQETKALSVGDNNINIEFTMKSASDARALFCAAMGAQKISDEHTLTFSNMSLVKIAEAIN